MEYINKTFNQLTILQDEKRNGRRKMVLCHCTRCNNLAVIRLDHIMSGNTKNCGCRKKESVEARRNSSPETYNIWLSMKARCNYPERFPDYGGRGISYDKNWEHYPNFLKDMGDKPSGEHSLDRIDVNKGYTKNNCRWATRRIQALNKRPRKTNTGIPGVNYSKKFNRYTVCYRLSPYKAQRKRFKTLEEAKKFRAWVDEQYSKEINTSIQ